MEDKLIWTSKANALLNLNKMATSIKTGPF
jgi:hypothetical protein